MEFHLRKEQIVKTPPVRQGNLVRNQGGPQQTHPLRELLVFFLTPRLPPATIYDEQRGIFLFRQIEFLCVSSFRCFSLSNRLELTQAYIYFALLCLPPGFFCTSPNFWARSTSLSCKNSPLNVFGREIASEEVLFISNESHLIRFLNW